MPSFARRATETSTDSGWGSVTRTRLIVSAENRNDTESASTANGAEVAAISTPPAAGPTMKEAERLPASLLLADTYSERGTRCAKKDGYEVLNSTAAVPHSAATT